MSNNRSVGLKSFLLLAGSFTFAFLLGETAHEYGHYLAHLACGSPGKVSVHLDPFGGSRIAGVAALPLGVMGFTCAAGPLFNLALALPVFVLLLRQRRAALLPLLFWVPVALVQEGVTFSLGLLTPGGDAQWVAAAGIPDYLILTLGMLLLAAGVSGVSWLLPLAGVQPGTSFWRRLQIVMAGMGILMLVRAAYSFQLSSAALIENLLPLVFSVLLSVLVVLLQKPVGRISVKEPAFEEEMLPQAAVVLSLLLGAGLFGLQIAF